MNESFEHVERQVASMRATAAPTELRGAVLTDVRRELRAARWDRRLARAAVVMLLLGVGLNVGVVSRWDDASDGRLVRERQSEVRSSLVDTAIVVAEATDALTAHRVAEQWAAAMGRSLTADEAAAIQTAARRPVVRGALNKG